MTNHAVCNRADLRERTKTMSPHGDRRGQIAAFRDSFQTINWLYLIFKCGIKTKMHFEWLLWHWSSLGQLNLEPTRPNGLVGCKVPTDLVKISVTKATHMGFYYIGHLIGSVNCDVTGPLWRNQKAVSCLGWHKSISDTRHLSHTPECTRQDGLATILSLTWESPSLGKMVFTLRRGHRKTYRWGCQS